MKFANYRIIFLSKGIKTVFSALFFVLAYLGIQGLPLVYAVGIETIRLLL